jgi:hypothetical protein
MRSSKKQSEKLLFHLMRLSYAVWDRQGRDIRYMASLNPVRDTYFHTIEEKKSTEYDQADHH